MQLIRKLENMTIEDVRRDLREAHEFLATCCAEHMKTPREISSSWGTRLKRAPVSLSRGGRPSVIEKEKEQLSEIINMIATVERLLGALSWFRERQEFRDLRVRICHPTTSSAPGENDLVLDDPLGQVVVRCEACDVTSTSASQNGKEASTLTALGCDKGVPADGVRRFICTSREFSDAISSPRRQWIKRGYRYRPDACGDDSDTVLLEVVAAPRDATPVAEPNPPAADSHKPRGEIGQG